MPTRTRRADQSPTSKPPRSKTRRSRARPSARRRGSPEIHVRVKFPRDGGRRSLAACADIAEANPRANVRDSGFGQISAILRGLAHARRMELCGLMAAGPRTYQDLQKAVSLAPGPLYHHLRELERAGLACAPARNEYRLTPEGEVWACIVAAGAVAAGLARGWAQGAIRARRVRS